MAAQAFGTIPKLKLINQPVHVEGALRNDDQLCFRRISMYYWSLWSSDRVNPPSLIPKIGPVMHADDFAGIVVADRQGESSRRTFRSICAPRIAGWNPPSDRAIAPKRNVLVGNGSDASLPIYNTGVWHE